MNIKGMNIKDCIRQPNVQTHHINDTSAPQALEYMKDVAREGNWTMAIVEPEGMLVLRGAPTNGGIVKAVLFRHITTTSSAVARQHTLSALELLGVKDTKEVSEALTRHGRSCVLADLDLPTTRCYAGA